MITLHVKHFRRLFGACDGAFEPCSLIVCKFYFGLLMPALQKDYTILFISLLFIACIVHLCMHFWWFSLLLCFFSSLKLSLFRWMMWIWKQMEKIPIDEITKELKSLGMSEEAIKELLQVLSLKSLTKLEGWLLLYLDSEVVWSSVLAMV